MSAYQWGSEDYQYKWDQTLSHCSLIQKTAEETGLDPNLIASLVFLESGGNESAISHQGAVGLMQVMPKDGIAAEFVCINGPCFQNRPSTDELLDPEFNIKYGSKYLANLVNTHGLRDGLVKYGPMGVGYSYADQVINIYEKVK